VDAADARFVRDVTITGVAHTALHVADAEAAVAWYRDVLGLRVLSPPYRMEGARITADMGELVPPPVVVHAAILGTADGDDRVIEVIEYPGARTGAPRPASVLELGFTHVGLVCDDIDATRAGLEAREVRFLTTGIAEVAGLRTTWFCDPWDNVFILLEKRARLDAPYYRQF
jgi:catechol 2,3-dioxygenase-like lactoylglutathione lyase family enzyme